MPWNIIGTHLESGVITPTYRVPPHEDDYIPSGYVAWQPSHSYHLEDEVLDSNGNVQRCKCSANMVNHLRRADGRQCGAVGAGAIGCGHHQPGCC